MDEKLNNPNKELNHQKQQEKAMESQRGRPTYLQQEQTLTPFHLRKCPTNGKPAIMENNLPMFMMS